MAHLDGYKLLSDRQHAFRTKKIRMAVKPLKIAAQIIFIDRQINLNTRNFKIIANNQENYKNKHGALFLRFSIYEGLVPYFVIKLHANFG